MIYTDERLKELAEATDKLYEKTKGQHIRNKNIIFIYCPPKVGSTSLVSSIRIFACDKFTIHHLHDDNPIHFITKKNNITILDIINYNNYIGKNVWVIDIYRTPLERKMSEFFEFINTTHFNTGNEKIKTYSIARITKRFNDIFSHIANEDYYKERYNIPFPESFDFSKKYMMQDIDGVKYIKLRLQDSDMWGRILTNILGCEIKIIREYLTEKKEIGELYKQFKAEYVMPLNYLEDIQKEEQFIYYNDEKERNEYTSKIKTGENHKGFTKEEYEIYKNVSMENSKGTTIIRGHYVDQGCICEICSKKRKNIRNSIHDGMMVEQKIWHNNLINEKNKNRLKIIALIKKKREKNNNFLKNKPNKPKKTLGGNLWISWK